MGYVTKRHLSRRAVLRGATGAAIALPLLDAMFPAMTAYAQSAAKPKTRFCSIYIPHGKTMAKWTPTKVGDNFELTEILQPMAPFHDQINIISGFGLPFAYGKDGSAGANHARSSAVFLTAAKPNEESSATRLGISVDQVAAKAIGQDTPLPSIELSVEEGGVSSGAYRNTISWQSETSPLPMYSNPQVIFEKLFGEGMSDAQRAALRAQSRSLLDSVMDDVAGLQRQLPAVDKVRLDQYLTDVREIERRITLAGKLPEGLRLPETPTGVPADFEAHVQMLFDLNVLAWQAEITRISTLMMAHELSNATYPNSTVRDPFHNLSHHSNLQANKDRFAVLNRYHVSQLAYFLDKLKTTKDGDGNLLDHAIVLYGSGISDGNQHNHDPLPILLAGGASGRLKGKRHLQVQNRTSLANLHVAILNKLGVPTTAFGDSTGIAEI